MDSNKDDFAVYLDNYSTFNSDLETELLAIINSAPCPLVRFWRWPNKAKSAFAISGDVDSITIFDFFRRFLYF